MISLPHLSHIATVGQQRYLRVKDARAEHLLDIWLRQLTELLAWDQPTPQPGNKLPDGLVGDPSLRWASCFPAYSEAHIQNSVVNHSGHSNSFHIHADGGIHKAERPVGLGVLCYIRCKGIPESTTITIYEYAPAARSCISWLYYMPHQGSCHSLREWCICGCRERRKSDLNIQYWTALSWKQTQPPICSQVNNLHSLPLISFFRKWKWYK